MIDYQKARREALKLYIDSTGVSSAELSRKLGYKNPSFISAMIGPKPSRHITEKTARKFEASLSLPLGTLEDPARVRALLDVKPQPAASAPRVSDTIADPVMPSIPLTADIVRMVGQVCEAENIAIKPMRFADLVALALTDAAEHGGQGRPEHIKALVNLLK